MDCLKNFRTRVEEQQTEHLQQHSCTVGHRWWWSSMAGSLVMLLGAIGIALGSVTPARADVIQCGDVLGPGGRFKLEHDLECPTGPGVTVEDGAILDLQGHIVTCPADTRCIILKGTGTQLLNGAINGGISVIPGGGSIVPPNPIFFVFCVDRDFDPTECGCWGRDACDCLRLACPVASEGDTAVGFFCNPFTAEACNNPITLP